MAGKKTIEWIGYVLEESIRILCMQLVLVPTAYLLPRKWALKIADAVSLPLAILPRPGIHTYWQMRRAFGRNRMDSFHLSWGWLARPFRDFVVLKRILYERENPFFWKIVERNAEGVKRLRETGESYIVASGHFLREGHLCMFSPTVMPGRPVQIGLSPPKRIRTLHDLRMRIQYGTLVNAFSACWGRDPEIVFVDSDKRAARILYRRLRDRGNVVSINVDAPWRKTLVGSYVRPFAGHRNRVFATGAAQLAREARCPIVSCVFTLGRDGTMFLDWGEPIRTGDQEVFHDTEVMDALIDRIEIAIGEEPTQYVLGVGYNRRWNSRSRRWEDVPEGSVT